MFNSEEEDGKWIIFKYRYSGTLKLGSIVCTWYKSANQSFEPSVLIKWKAGTDEIGIEHKKRFEIADLEYVVYIL